MATHVLRQDAFRAAGRSQDARDWYGRSMAEYPDDPTRLLLNTRVAPGPDDARAAGYERALRLDPASAWARIALVYELLREREKTAAYGRRRADLGYRDEAAAAEQRAARCLERAEGLAREAIARAPLLAAAHGALADVLLLRCRLCEPQERPPLEMEALEAAERCAGLSPGHPDVLLRLARALHGAAQDEDAAEALAEAIEIAPRDFVLHANLGRVLLDLREDEEALASLETAHGLRPRDVDVLLNLGVARFRTGDTVGARRAFLDASDLAPDDPRPIERLATIHAEDAGTPSGGAE
jgi:tetratricopeptide (TPR) repeat protein